MPSPNGHARNRSTVWRHAASAPKTVCRCCSTTVKTTPSMSGEKPKPCAVSAGTVIAQGPASSHSSASSRARTRPLRMTRI